MQRKDSIKLKKKFLYTVLMDCANSWPTIIVFTEEYIRKANLN